MSSSGSSQDGESIRTISYWSGVFTLGPYMSSSDDDDEVEYSHNMTSRQERDYMRILTTRNNIMTPGLWDIYDELKNTEAGKIIHNKELEHIVIIQTGFNADEIKGMIGYNERYGACVYIWGFIDGVYDYETINFRPYKIKAFDDGELEIMKIKDGIEKYGYYEMGG